MSQGKGHTGYIAAGLGWGIALGVAAGLLVIGPAMGVIQWDGQSSATSVAGEDDIATLKNEQADALISAEYKKLLEGALDGQNVIVLRTSDANDADVDAVKWQLMTAGAKSAGEIRFSEQLIDQNHADALSTVIATTLPAGAQLSVEHRSPGMHAGQSLGAVLFADPQTGEPVAPESDRKFVIEALKGGGFIEEASIEAPATAAVLVTGEAAGGSGNSFGEQLLVDMTHSFKNNGGAVLAGPISDWDTESITAVPFIDTEAGRVQTVLSLADSIATAEER